jgi:hypothetical protein
MSAIVAGVDEAGLGPLLGPLTIGYSALRLPSVDADPWKLLARRVAPRPARGERRVVVADSKKVFARTAPGRQRLETTALSFLALLLEEESVPRDGREVLFGALRPSEEMVARHPWYEHLPPLPRHVDAGRVELVAAGLARELTGHESALVDAGVRVVPAGELNASYRETENKGDTVWHFTLEVLRHLWTAHGEQELRIIADLQGARSHYGPPLARGFPDASVRRLREDAEVSSYELVERNETERGGWLPRRMTVEFRARGEEYSFATALASCLAKYARETVMTAFNAYFHSLQPGLRPTAGYTTDGRRWLEDARETLAGSTVERDVLIRTR